MQVVKTIIRLELPHNKGEAIIRSLMPDNINFPDGIRMDMSLEDYLRIEFVCNDISKIKSMINTIDETLEHISMILNILSEKNARS